MPSAAHSVLISSHYLPLREVVYFLKDAAVIFVDENEVWKKQTLRNRTCILGANGVQSLSVPVMHTGGKKTAMKDILISYNEPWIRIHKGALFSAYNTSAFFNYFKEDLFCIYDEKPEHLFDLNQKIFKLILKKLKFKGIVEVYNQQPVESDLRTLDTMNAIKEKKIALENYNQVFGYKYEFSSHLSCLDVLANTGSI